MTHSQDATGGTIGRAGEIINRFRDRSLTTIDWDIFSLKEVV